MINMQHGVRERFLRYVRINTQSNPFSDTFPSTSCQLDFANLLVEELQDLGISDAHLDSYGYVYGSLPSNVDHPVPVVCFCAHMDTSPDVTGEGIIPQVHANYAGDPISFPDNPSLFISPQNQPDLADQLGNDIITASGLTLLGADNKAGVAAIMDAIALLKANPELPHGTLKFLFTPDEEIGRGVDHVDLVKLGADFAYTIDGEKRGSLENETFSADLAIVTFHGVSSHPGFGFGLLENSLKIASLFIQSLPKESLSPETTRNSEGFIHPVHIAGKAEATAVHLILRDFSNTGLAYQRTLIRKLAEEALKTFPQSSVEVQFTEQYRNMREVLNAYPFVLDYAEEAMRRAGVKPIRSSIRGGTDGSRLSFMGLPCPNLFAGEHAFHSLQEWVSVQDMEKASETIIHLAGIWSAHRTLNYN